ncbi:MAG: hypothetical protein COA45_05970 [Zetaproteobacteria bacterium]|nr:MAG: hypothetical protein COA45_05970 [Zetaproteobacteria bacterium]
MKRSYRLIILSFTVLLLGCQNTAIAPQLQNLLPNLERNVVRVDDFIMKMNWCLVSQNRTAECEVEITSLYQDKKAAIIYPKLQDDKGKEFRMKRKNGSVSGQVMVAKELYTQYLVVENLPTYTKRVRSVVGIFVAWDLRGHKIAEKPIVFSNIPVKLNHERVHAKPTPTNTKHVKPVLTNAKPMPKTTHQTGSLNNSYWHGKINPVVEIEENGGIRLWKNGAYLHFRDDGIAGFNWSEAKNYSYHNFNIWSQNGDSFTLTMSGAIYTFNIENNEGPLIAYLQPGGAFKMMLTRR